MLTMDGSMKMPISESRLEGSLDLERRRMPMTMARRRESKKYVVRTNGICYFIGWFKYILLTIFQ